MRVIGLSAALVLTNVASGSLVTINFDTAPGAIPLSFYSSQGLTSLGLLGGNLGPSGGGMLTAGSPPVGMPAPAAGLGIVPYANLAGFMSSFEMTFATPVDFLSIWAFDGPQAFTVQAFRLGSPVSTLNIPAEPGRVAVELSFGSIGSSTRIDRVVVNPVAGIGGSDPQRGPKYFDELKFNTIPTPSTAALFVGALVARRRRGR